MNTRRGSSFKDINLVQDAKNLRDSFNRHLHFYVVKDRNIATMRDFYVALARTVWDQLCSRWMKTREVYAKEDPKMVYFLSMEFFMGRTLKNTMLNVDVAEALDEAMYQLGLDIEELEEMECDAGLGNGGLGRLAACFLDSMATIGLPAYGYGIRYENGAFHQKIKDGWQIEEPDEWLLYGNPWEKERPECTRIVQFYGRVVRNDLDQCKWVDTATICALPYEVPIPGYCNQTCNTLRLWAAKGRKCFDTKIVNNDDYVNAILGRNEAEDISRVLYPIDSAFEGKELQLKQEYFLVSATLQDILCQFKLSNPTCELFELPNKVVIHINDTHPALAIPELLRILVDIECMDWIDALDICSRVFTHTNHVSQIECLKYWPLDMLQRVLPRHVEIMHKIDCHFKSVINRRWPSDKNRFQRMSIFQEINEPVASMDHLCIIGSHFVNGVSIFQTNHLINTLFKDFADLWPSKFTNKTNGISPRRWLLVCNPGLTDLIRNTIQSDDWVKNLITLNRLKEKLNDENFRNSLVLIKQDNKNRFVAYMKQHRNISLDPSSLFDVHVKRVLEYKRPLLPCLYAITMYNRLRANPSMKMCPRTVIIGGKAAPGYYMAKVIIKLINSVARIIDFDPITMGKLKLLFLRNYRVSLAERIIPATDLSEQIPCVGTEASGTGNMKFMLNGALTIGTMDGSNIEIFQEVGHSNAFIFGRTVEEVNHMRKTGYNPMRYVSSNPELRLCLEQIRDGFFCPTEPDLFKELYRKLVTEDKFMVCADYASYMRAQAEVDSAYRDEVRWSKMSLMNIAAAGKFSSDRTVREYARDIWRVEPINIK
ncbi:Glycogen phosphorylase, liver form [Schistosoma japonicum]|nr:Glycogen phosphorylase, liver form [Schistosoma japonicum]